MTRVSSTDSVRLSLPEFPDLAYPTRMIAEQLRTLITRHGRLPVDLSTVADDTDLYEIGLTSLTTVNLLLAIEEHFDIEFPDDLLARRTFRSIDSLVSAISSLT